MNADECCRDRSGESSEAASFAFQADPTSMFVPHPSSITHREHYYPLLIGFKKSISKLYAYRCCKMASRTADHVCSTHVLAERNAMTITATGLQHVRQPLDCSMFFARNNSYAHIVKYARTVVVPYIQQQISI
jgi:hypothetical protein